MSAPERPRVALTMEQSWHRVPGGVAVAALGMANALSRREDVEVVGVAARHRDPPPTAWRPDVPLRHLGLPRPLLYEAWHRLRWPKVQSATGSVDVIHATTTMIPPRSAPLIVTIHDLAPLAEPAHFTRRGLRFFSRGLQLARREADLVMCPSVATKEACLRHGFEHERVRVIPLGVTTGRAAEGDVRAARSKYDLDRPYVLWTGTIEPRKNLKGLLEAFRSLRGEIDLVLVGPKGWNEDLDALVREIGSEVKVLGFVPKRELDALYAGADVFCFPSHLEGFGFPVLEAMAQGTPVVTSRGTSTEELAGDVAVLVDPASPTDIAAGITSVLEDDALARKLAEEGPARAAGFTWERTAALLVEAYREVAA